MIIKNLLSYCYVQEFYQNILSSAQLKVNETIADDILYSIVRFYIQVRAFFFLQETLFTRIELKTEKSKQLNP